MAHLDLDAFREFRQMYEQRVKLGNEDFDETIRAYAHLLASRKILNYAISLAVKTLEMLSVLETACGILSAQALRPSSVSIQGVHELNKLDLQQWVLQLKGLATDESEIHSRTTEPGSAAGTPEAPGSADGDRLVEQRNFLAYVTAMTDDKLGWALAVQAAVGVPCVRALRHVQVLVRVGRELRKLELEDAKLRAKALGIEFPDALARALEYGDVEHVSKLLDSKTHSKS